MSSVFESPSQKRPWGEEEEPGRRSPSLVGSSKRRRRVRPPAEELPLVEEPCGEEEPGLQQQGGGGGAPRWRCGGAACGLGRWRRHAGSIWSQGEVQRLSEGGAPLQEQSALRLFGAPVCPGPQGLEDLLEGLLHALDTLHTAATDLPGFSRLGLEVAEVEGEVAECLALLRQLAWQCRQEGRDGAGLWLVARRLLAAQGRVFCLPGSVLAAPGSPLLHTWLEVRWGVLALLHYLGQAGADAPPLLLLPPHLAPLPDAPAPLLQQLVTATMLDLLELARRRLASLPASHLTLCSLTSLQCPCVEELWLCLLQVSGLAGLQPWQLLLTACSGGSEGAAGEDSALLHYAAPGGDPELCMAVFSSLAHLLQDSGLKSEEQVAGLVRAARQLVRWAAEQKPQEERLRLVIQLVLSLQAALGPSLDLFDELWSRKGGLLFSSLQRLNSACRLQKMTLEGATSLPASPSSWLGLVSALPTAPTIPHPPSALPPHTSFQAFLQLTIQALQSWKKQVSKNAERLVTRFQLKLTPSLFCQLNEYGLYHCGSLLLLLCRAGEPRASQLLLQLLSSPGLPSPSSSPRVTRLKLGLAACLLQAEEGSTMLGPAGLVRGMVEAAVREYAGDRNNVKLRQVMADLVAVWRAGVEEVALTSQDLATGEQALLGDWLTTYLAVSTDENTAALCRTLSKLLTRVRFVQGDSLQASSAGLSLLVAALWREVQPALRTRAGHLTAPPEVPKLLADFVQLEAQTVRWGAGAGGREGVVEMIRSMERGVRPGLALVFLHRLVLLPVMAPQALILAEGLSLVSLHLGPGHPEHGQLKAAWAAVARSLDMVQPGEEQEDVALVVLEQSIASGHSGLVRRMAAECSVLWKRDPRQGRTYLLAGWLARHATALLYQPGNTALFNSLKNIIAPNIALAEDWRPPPEAESSIRLALPLFLVGLAGTKGFLDSRHLRRVVEDIVKIYFRCWEPTAGHPLLAIFRQDTELPEDTQEDVQKLVLTTLVNLVTNIKLQKNWFLGGRTLKFLALCGSSSCIVQEVALPLILEIVSNIDDLGLRNPAFQLFKEIVLKADEDFLTEKLLEFVSKSLAFNCDRTFQTLTVIALIRPQFARQLIRPMGSQVHSVEAKRGGGRDRKLQELLGKFETTVYEKL